MHSSSKQGAGYHRSSWRARATRRVSGGVAGAVLHDTQSHAFNRSVHVRQSNAVIVNSQGNISAARLQADANVAGLAVLERIGDGFLSDAVQLRRGEIVFHRHGLGALE